MNYSTGIIIVSSNQSNIGPDTVSGCFQYPVSGRISGAHLIYCRYSVCKSNFFHYNKI
jgi:hypothetical protein